MLIRVKSEPKPKVFLVVKLFIFSPSGDHSEMCGSFFNLAVLDFGVNVSKQVRLQCTRFI